MPSDYGKISTQDLEEKLERAVALLVGLYTERTHFIFELLQNAEDAEATRMRFDSIQIGLKSGMTADCSTETTYGRLWCR